MEISENLKILLEPFDPSKITLFGVKLGDELSKIPDAIRTDDSPFANPYWANTIESIGFRKSEKDESICSGFFLREEFVKDLKIDTEGRIQQLFGNAHGIEKRRGMHYYFFPDRKLVVTWWKEYEKLFGIYLGDGMILQTQINALGFLNQYFEFKSYVPNMEDWTEEKLRWNAPRFYRLKQLNTLLIAFNIGTDLRQDFVSLKFLEKRKPEDFEPIYADIERYSEENEGEFERYETEKKRIKTRGLRMVIQEFLRFSETIRDTLNFNSGWLETGSVDSRYLINKTQKLLNTINRQQLIEIEELLCKVISPDGKIFTLSELIKEHNYPDVDLEQIDMDNY